MRAQNKPSRTPSRASAQQTVETPPIRTFPTETRRAPMPWAAWVMILAGTAATSAGGLMASGVLGESGKFAWYSQRLAEGGVLPGHLLAAGLGMGAAGVIGLFLCRVARTLLAPGAVEDALAEVGADLAEYRNKLYEFENDHLHFRTELEAVRTEVREHRQKDRSPEAVDALFRMAGSLDTLHARFDQKLAETSQGVDRTLRELGGLIESSRDFLQESLEENDQRVEGIAARLWEMTTRMAAPAVPAMSAAADESAALPVATTSQEEEETSSEGAEDAGAPGLGLLDELDDLSYESWDAGEDGEDEGAQEPATDPAASSPAAPAESLHMASPAEPGPGPEPSPSAYGLSPSADPGPTRVDLEAPMPPLPGGPEAESHLDRMQDVVRDAERPTRVDLDFGSGEA